MLYRNTDITAHSEYTSAKTFDSGRYLKHEFLEVQLPEANSYDRHGNKLSNDELMWTMVLAEELSKNWVPVSEYQAFTRQQAVLAEQNRTLRALRARAKR